jgi:predicted Zn-dependent peptidase
VKSEVSTLPNGLRVASCSIPSSQMVAVGIWCAVGSRHEPARLTGLSHFLEHLLFKGTRKRSARQISEEVEGVGGDLNAYTTEDRTCYYAAAPADYFPRVTEVLSDMYCNSRLDPVEIECERGVIAEEIDMVRDEPTQHVHELLTSLTWKGHSLARPITGTKKTLSAITRRDLRDHLQSHYHAGRTILTAAGAVNHEDVVKLASRVLGKLSKLRKGSAARVIKTLAPQRQRSPRILIESRENQQTQLALSFRGVGSSDPRRYALNLLHVILGGNMSSRLFQELRERRGLCYSVSSSLSTHTDCGSFDISLGLDERNVAKSLKLIMRECRRLAKKGPSIAELCRACDYSIGTSRMALERTATQNYRLGTSLLTYGKIIPPEEVYERLTKVTVSEVRDVAARILSEQTLCLAMLGQGPSKEELLRLIRGR